MKMMKTSAALLAVTTLAACGGNNQPADLSLQEIGERGIALQETVSTIPYTDPATLPTRSSATYSGFVATGVGPDVLVGGQLELTASFAGNGGIDGRIFNISDTDGISYRGELEIGNGEIDRGADTSVEFTFNADIDGAVRGGGQTVSVDGTLLGDFSGSNHQYVQGFIDGTATIAGETLDLIDGEFVAER